MLELDSGVFESRSGCLKLELGVLELGSGVYGLGCLLGLINTKCYIDSGKCRIYMAQNQQIVLIIGCLEHSNVEDSRQVLEPMMHCVFGCVTVAARIKSNPAEQCTLDPQPLPCPLDVHSPAVS